MSYFDCQLLRYQFDPRDLATWKIPEPYKANCGKRVITPSFRNQGPMRLRDLISGTRDFAPAMAMAIFVMTHGGFYTTPENQISALPQLYFESLR